MAYTRIGTITATNRHHLAEKVANLPEGYDIKAGPRSRSLDQNAMLHAMCGQLSKCLEFAGAKRTLEQWKILLISGHAIATKHGADMLPGLEGEWVNLRESSASMTVQRLNSLIEYALAYGAQHGVKFHDTCCSN